MSLEYKVWSEVDSVYSGQKNWCPFLVWWHPAKQEQQLCSWQFPQQFIFSLHKRPSSLTTTSVEERKDNLKSYKNPLKPLNINMLFYTHFMEENVQLGNQLKWFIFDDHCLLKFPWTSLLKRKQILPGEMSCWSLITYSSLNHPSLALSDIFYYNRMLTNTMILLITSISK